MGADRRGPLVALILVALVAGIMLATAVRSHAAPAWRATRHHQHAPVATPRG